MMTRTSQLVAYVALVLAAVALFAAAVLYADHQRQIDRIEELRQQRVEDYTNTDILICRKLNDASDILADLLRFADVNRRRERRESTASERKALAEFLRRLEPQNCADLESAKHK